MIDNTSAITLASVLLGIPADEMKDYCIPLEELGAYYFSVPVKGGDSLIISGPEDVLYANSSVSYDSHIQEFRKGRRTPIEAFTNHE